MRTANYGEGTRMTPQSKIHQRNNQYVPREKCCVSTQGSETNESRHSHIPVLRRNRKAGRPPLLCVPVSPFSPHLTQLQSRMMRYATQCATKTSTNQQTTSPDWSSFKRKRSGNLAELAKISRTSQIHHQPMTDSWPMTHDTIRHHQASPWRWQIASTTSTSTLHLPLLQVLYHSP